MRLPIGKFAIQSPRGDFSLDELAEVTVFGGVPAVERDLYWEPKTLGEARKEYR